MSLDIGMRNAEGTGKMRLVRPPASGASSMVRAGLGLGVASWIWLGSW